MTAPSAERTRAMLGTRIEEWTLEEVLSVGPRTAIYVARSESDDRVVVRMLHPEHEHDARVRGAVLREAWMGSDLFHPARVKTISVGHHEGRTLYLAQEHVAGLPLDLLMLRDGALDLDSALGLVDTMLQVVESYHRRNVAHGPIVPSKIILEPSGSARVLHCSDEEPATSPEALAAAMTADIAACGLLFASLLGGASLSTTPHLEWLEPLVRFVAAEASGDDGTLLAARLSEFFRRTLFADPSPFPDARAARTHLLAAHEDQLLAQALLEEWPSPRRVPIHSQVVPRNDPSWSDLIVDGDGEDTGTSGP